VIKARVPQITGVSSVELCDAGTFGEISIHKFRKAGKTGRYTPLPQAGFFLWLLNELAAKK
jgi:hypothetical protein